MSDEKANAGDSTRFVDKSKQSGSPGKASRIIIGDAPHPSHIEGNGTAESVKLSDDKGTTVEPESPDKKRPLGDCTNIIDTRDAHPAECNPSPTENLEVQAVERNRFENRPVTEASLSPLDSASSKVGFGDAAEPETEVPLQVAQEEAGPSEPQPQPHHISHVQNSQRPEIPEQLSRNYRPIRAKESHSILSETEIHMTNTRIGAERGKMGTFARGPTGRGGKKFTPRLKTPSEPPSSSSHNNHCSDPKHVKASKK